jgi:hypothetical protein
MNAIFENVAELNKVAFAQASKATEFAAQTLEQYAAFGVAQFKAQISETKADLAAAAAIREIQDLANLRAKFDSKIEAAGKSARELYDLSAQKQAEASKLFEDSQAELSQAFVAFVDKTAKSVPSAGQFGGEAFAQGMKNAFAAQQAAQENFTKFAQETFSKVKTQTEEFVQTAKAAVPAAKAKK